MLSVFLTTVGVLLDDKNFRHRNYFTEVWKKLAAHVQDEKLSFRVRCLIRDVLELRDESWEASSPAKAAAVAESPKTLSKVHEEFSFLYYALIPFLWVM